MGKLSQRLGQQVKNKGKKKNTKGIIKRIKKGQLNIEYICPENAEKILEQAKEYKIKIPEKTKEELIKESKNNSKKKKQQLTKKKEK